MKRLAFLLLLNFFVMGANAQTAEDSVKAVINRLFDGMKESDAAKIRSVFADSAVLQTIGTNKDGSFVVNDSVVEFADFVSKQAKGDADERIVFDVIKIDGPLAMVWAPYKFYFKGNFSHCGVDSFQLVKIKGEWKIQYLIDTRRRKGCE